MGRGAVYRFRNKDVVVAQLSNDADSSGTAYFKIIKQNGVKARGNWTQRIPMTDLVPLKQPEQVPVTRPPVKPQQEPVVPACPSCGLRSDMGYVRYAKCPNCEFVSEHSFREWLEENS